MYTGNVEIYFSEDEKTSKVQLMGLSVDEIKRKSIEAILLKAKTYSMLPGEIVISLSIEKDGVYIDSEELFAEYDGKKIMFAA